MIDLRSDTITKPSDEMREAAKTATVGDDKRDGDPTVRELESLVADRLGMEAAVFVPSGTMANQIAIRAHISPGKEVVVDRRAHVYTSEYASVPQLSHGQIRPIDFGDKGYPTPEQVKDGISERTQWPGTGLLTLENTHNKRGGVAVDASKLTNAAKAAHDLDIPVHLDGARLANASVALDQPLDAFTAEMDTVMFDLSKGLGAPVGAVLAGKQEIIELTRQYRFVFGGGMRQAGIIAGPGIVSMGNIDRLATDHKNAALLAETLSTETELVVNDPETNIVIVDTEPAGMTATEFLEECESVDVLGGSIDAHTVRFCTHLDVTENDIATAANRIAKTLTS